MKIYISGQITGLPVAEYTEKFSRAEAKLKAKGYLLILSVTVCLPAHVGRNR